MREDKGLVERRHNDTTPGAARAKEGVYLAAYAVSEPVRLIPNLIVPQDPNGNSESNCDVRRTLQQHRPELLRARAGLSSLVVSYPQITAPLIETLDRATTASIAGSRDCMLSDAEFSFDYELVNTRVYGENMERLVGRGNPGK